MAHFSGGQVQVPPAWGGLRVEERHQPRARIRASAGAMLVFKSPPSLPAGRGRAGSVAVAVAGMGAGRGGAAGLGLGVAAAGPPAGRRAAGLPCRPRGSGLLEGPPGRACSEPWAERGPPRPRRLPSPGARAEAASPRRDVPRLAGGERGRNEPEEGRVKVFSRRSGDAGGKSAARRVRGAERKGEAAPLCAARRERRPPRSAPLRGPPSPGAGRQRPQSRAAPALPAGGRPRGIAGTHTRTTTSNVFLQVADVPRCPRGAARCLYTVSGNRIKL